MKVRKAVIPCAGMGTRMLPSTKSVPKEMLPLVDRPVLSYIAEEAALSGIEDILIITNRGKSAIDDYFDYTPELEERLRHDGKLKELESVRKPAELANISYMRQKETKGLGHAVWCAKRFVGNEPFAVLLGDDVMRSQTPVTKQLIDALQKYDASAVGSQFVTTEAIRKYSSLKQTQLESHIYRVHDVNEKPLPGEEFSNYAILGRYVLMPQIFGILENTPPGHGNEIQLTDALKTLCQNHPMVAVDFEGKRYDTGNLTGFLEAVLDFALAHNETGQWLKQFITDKVATWI